MLHSKNIPYGDIIARRKCFLFLKTEFFSGLIERKICSNTSPCKVNEGECFLDNQCKDGLVCIRNNCNSLFIATAFENSGNFIIHDKAMKLTHLELKVLSFYQRDHPYIMSTCF